MAGATRSFCRILVQTGRNSTKRLIGRRLQSPSITTRQFCLSQRRFESKSSSPTLNPTQSPTVNGEIEPSEYLSPSNPITVKDLDAQERATYETLSKSDQDKYLRLQNHYKAIFESAASDEDLDRLADEVDREIDRQQGPLDFPSNRARGSEVGFWADDEDDEFGVMEDGDEDFSDEYITSVAESELQLQREIREYTRVAAWDMPLLHKFAKPFEAPSSKSPLRFRYTTYMGEYHPAAKKVVVQFCTKDLEGLSESQRIKLIKLVGVRYNPDTDVVRMSCEKFEAAAQNKRYLGDLVNKLIAEAKDPADSFEDVPLDLRHHKSKTVPQYPEEWKIKPKTIQKLLGQRQETHLLGESSEPVDGRQMVEAYVQSAGGRRSLSRNAIS